MKYRICRLQRFQKEGWAFTLPLDAFTFDTAKKAFEHLQKPRIGFADNNFWIQEMSDDGKFSEFPKSLPGVPLPWEGVQESEPASQDPVPTEAPIADRELSDWEKVWGYKKPVLRGDS